MRPPARAGRLAGRRMACAARGSEDGVVTAPGCETGAAWEEATSTVVACARRAMNRSVAGEIA